MPIYQISATHHNMNQAYLKLNEKRESIDINTKIRKPLKNMTQILNKCEINGKKNLSKEIEDVNQDQIKPLELKNLITEIKANMQLIQSAGDKRISEQEERTT